MAYIDVVTLDDAKTYLRIDDTLSDDDSQIISMINSASRIVEQRTNVLFYARSKNYLFDGFSVMVYDYPINSIVNPANVTSTQFELYTVYETDKSSDKTLTLNVGYQNPQDVPDDLKNIVLNLVKHWYYESETNANHKGQLPIFVEQAMELNKRFII